MQRGGAFAAGRFWRRFLSARRQKAADLGAATSVDVNIEIAMVAPNQNDAQEPRESSVLFAVGLIAGLERCQLRQRFWRVPSSWMKITGHSAAPHTANASSSHSSTAAPRLQPC